MRKVYQTNMTPGEGNCLAACVASIEMDLHNVPDFNKKEDNRKTQSQKYHEFLRECGLGDHRCECFGIIAL